MRFLLLFILLVALCCSTSFASPFTLGSYSHGVILPRGYDHADLKVSIRPENEVGFDYSQITVDAESEDQWVLPRLNVAEKCVELRFRTADLSSSVSATVKVTHGVNTQTISLSGTTKALNVFKMVSDPKRSRVYGLQLDGVNRGSVLIMDALTGAAISSVTVGQRPTDLAISNDGTELFVINCVSKNISVIRLDTLLVSDVLAFPDAGNYYQSITTANLAVGPGDTLYYTGIGSIPTLNVYDRSTQQVLQTLTISPTEGIGGLALNADKTKLLAWAQKGWFGQSSPYRLARFTVGADGRLTLQGTGDEVLKLGSYKESPLLVSPDGETLFVGDAAVNEPTLSTINRKYPSAVFSISPGAEVSVTDRAIYDNATGKRLLELPAITQVHTLTPDYARLIFFDPETKTIGTLNLPDLLDAEAIGSALSPGSAAILQAPASLSWSSQAGATGYDVYLGNTHAGVQSAEKSSPAYLGFSATASLVAPENLVPGKTYFWRVDSLFGEQSKKGGVYSFTVSPLACSVGQIRTATVMGHANHRVQVTLEATSSSLPWSASTQADWLKIETAEGNGSGTLVLTMDASKLFHGVYVTEVKVSGPTGTYFTLPVKLSVEAMKVTHLVSDRHSSKVYGLNTSGLSELSKAYLLEMDAATESILRVVPVGSGFLDLAIHDAENRIYVLNSSSGNLIALNKTTLEEERFYAFSALSEASGSDNVSSVSAGKSGRLMLTDWSQMRSIFDTVAGVKLSNYSEYGSHGALDPTGRHYYHGGPGSFSREIYKLDVSGDAFTPSAEATSSSILSDTGVSSVVISEDGQSVFWNGSLFNAALEEQWALSDLIYAVSSDGRLAFGQSKIYDTVTRQQVMKMPVSTLNSAYNSTTKKLVIRDGAKVVYYPIQLPVKLAAPVIEPTHFLPEPAKVSWTGDPFSLSYEVQYRAVGAVSWITVSPLLIKDDTTAPLSQVLPNTDYEVRVRGLSAGANSAWSEIVIKETRSGSAPNLNLTNLTVAAGGLELAFHLNFSPQIIDVERATSSKGPWVVIAEVHSQQGRYVDPSAEPGVEYYYRLKAKRGSLVVISNTLSGMRSSSLRLDQPIPMEAVVKISGYNSVPGREVILQRSLLGSGYWVNVTTLSGEVLSYTDTFEDPSARWWYRLRVAVPGNEDLFSNAVMVSLPLSLSLPAPKGFGVTRIQPSEIHLTWQDMPNEREYILSRRGVNDFSWQLLARLPSDTTSYIDRSVVPARSYVYQISAHSMSASSSSAMTGVLKAEVPAAILEDDFDPDTSFSQWSQLSGGYALNHSAGFNGTQALWMGQAGQRLAKTRPLNVSSGGMIEFSMRAGNLARDNAYWDNSEPGEEVVLEYSFDGESWTTLQLFDTVFPALSDWTDFSLPIPPAAYSSTTSFRWRQKANDGYRNDAWALDNVKISAVIDPTLRVVREPESQLVEGGSPASFSVMASQPASTYQWHRDGVPVPGATASTYSISQATASTAAAYTCKVTHGNDMVFTKEAALIVIYPGVTKHEVKVGVPFHMKVDIYAGRAATDLNFQWYKLPVYDPAGPPLYTWYRNSISFYKATSAVQGSYYCQIVYEDKHLTVGPYEVKVLAPPIIEAVPDMEIFTGTVVDIPVTLSDPDAVVKVTGLPKGVSYDAATGRIQGKANSRKKYKVTLRATNSYGSATPVSFTLNVQAANPALAGTYRGVFTEGVAPYHYGGQISCQVTPQGRVTGQVTLLGKNHRFASSLFTLDNGTKAYFDAAVTNGKNNKLYIVMELNPIMAIHPIYINDEVDSNQHRLLSGFAFRREVNPPTLTGLVNLELRPQELSSFPDPASPQGTGFLSMKVSPRGTVTIKGRLADGQVVTSSSLMGRSRFVPWFVNLYQGKGSIVSLTFLSEETQSYAYWGKDAAAISPKKYTHSSGFRRHTLVMNGGLYVRPGSPEGFDLTALNRLTFSDGGLPAPISAEVGFTDKFKPVPPLSEEENLPYVTLKFNAATGLFSGMVNFKYPRPDSPMANHYRMVPYQGCLIPGLNRGAGYFLLPDMLDGNKPETWNNPYFWSGNVELVPDVEP